VRVMTTIRRVVIPAAALLYCIALLGCTPRVKAFTLVPVTSVPLPQSEIKEHQGVTFVCAGTALQLSWSLKGRGSLSASTGPRYRPPMCMPKTNVSSSGKQLVVAGVSNKCGEDTVLRIEARKDFWHPFGTCPGYGCDHADHEVIVVGNERVEEVGRKLADSDEVSIPEPSLNWDGRLHVQTVAAGTGLPTFLERHQGCKVTISHGGVQAVIDASTLQTESFSGQTFGGNWVLHLSQCSERPVALIAEVKLACRN
jgi:hypothetical protein